MPANDRVTIDIQGDESDLVRSVLASEAALERLDRRAGRDTLPDRTSQALQTEQANRARLARQIQDDYQQARNLREISDQLARRNVANQRNRTLDVERELQNVFKVVDLRLEADRIEQATAQREREHAQEQQQLDRQAQQEALTHEQQQQRTSQVARAEEAAYDENRRRRREAEQVDIGLFDQDRSRQFKLDRDEQIGHEEERRQLGNVRRAETTAYDDERRREDSTRRGEVLAYEEERRRRAGIERGEVMAFEEQGRRHFNLDRDEQIGHEEELRRLGNVRRAEATAYDDERRRDDSTRRGEVLAYDEEGRRRAEVERGEVLAFEEERRRRDEVRRGEVLAYEERDVRRVRDARRRVENLRRSLRGIGDFNRQLLHVTTGLGLFLIVTGLIAGALAALPTLISLVGLSLGVLAGIFAARYTRTLEAAQLQTGLLASELQRAHAATDQLGLSMNQTAGLIQRAQNRLDRLTLSPSFEDLETLQRLGIDLTDARRQGESVVETLRRISAAVQGLSQAEQRDILGRLFGRDQALVQLLSSGRFARALELAGQNLRVLSETENEAIISVGAVFNRILNDLQAHVRGFTADAAQAIISLTNNVAARVPRIVNSLVDVLIPAIDRFSANFNQTWERGEQFIRDAAPTYDRLVLRLRQAGSLFTDLGLSGPAIVDLAAAMLALAAATRILGPFFKLLALVASGLAALRGLAPLLIRIGGGALAGAAAGSAAPGVGTAVGAVAGAAAAAGTLLLIQRVLSEESEDQARAEESKAQAQETQISNLTRLRQLNREIADLERRVNQYQQIDESNQAQFANLLQQLNVLNAQRDALREQETLRRRQLVEEARLRTGQRERFEQARTTRREQQAAQEAANAAEEKRLRQLRDAEERTNRILKAARERREELEKLFDQYRQAQAATRPLEQGLARLDMNLDNVRDLLDELATQPFSARVAEELQTIARTTGQSIGQLIRQVRAPERALETFRQRQLQARPFEEAIARLNVLRIEVLDLFQQIERGGPNRELGRRLVELATGSGREVAQFIEEVNRRRVGNLLLTLEQLEAVTRAYERSNDAEERWAQTGIALIQNLNSQLAQTITGLTDVEDAFRSFALGSLSRLIETLLNQLSQGLVNAIQDAVPGTDTHTASGTASRGFESFALGFFQGSAGAFLRNTGSGFAPRASQRPVSPIQNVVIVRGADPVETRRAVEEGNAELIRFITDDPTGRQLVQSVAEGE